MLERSNRLMFLQNGHFRPYQYSMKAVELLKQSKKELMQISVNPYQESLWILAKTLNLSLTEIYLKNNNINKKQEQLFFYRIQRRKQGEPLEYILQETCFFNKKFYIEKGVFIPRPETEVLIHLVLKLFPSPQKLKVIDFGAGSGVLCLTLLSYFPKSQFLALEVSPKGIKCLKKNRRTLKVAKQVSILQNDVCQVSHKKLISCLGGPPSLIVANPPYIDPRDNSIDKPVYWFEPPLALFSDKKGMGHITSWLKKAMDILAPQGIYIFEIGWNQLEEVKNLCNQQRELMSYEIHKDFSGIPRAVVCVKK